MTQVLQGTKSECMRAGEKVEREALARKGVKAFSWSVVPIDRDKGIWALMV
jgi:hypothetical protein